MKLINAVWLFVRIVWRDFHGVRISWKTAWEVSKGIHFNKFN